MCGIAGFWNAKGLQPESAETVEAMLESIRYRGPDGTGHHIDDKGAPVMGHCRLSIIGLESGQQPLHSPQGDLVFTGNGEFYDYKRIRAGLALQGDAFLTRSDSEIALPLYQRYGLDFVQHLRGEFAFALYDSRQQRLILVRDRFGIKPLYFHMTEDFLCWGSEIKAVLAHPEVPGRLCRKAALHQLMQVMVPGTTAFEGVQALLPGHMLIVDCRDGRFTSRSHRYWDLDYPQAGEHKDHEPAEYYIEGVRQRLLDAVALRLEADVPVGCYLSGGIDSCSILGLASALQQSEVKAFTISFDHSAYDESAIAREMAERAGADQDVLKLTASELYGDSFETVTRHAERTFYNTLAVAKWHMSRHVNRCGYKVVVTGEGSDELFGGYPFFKRDYLLHDPDMADVAEGAGGLFEGAILAETDRTHDAWQDLCGFTPSWIQPWMLTLERVRGLLSDDAQEELRDYDPIAAIAETIDADKVRGRHPLDIAQYTWAKTMLEGQILTWGGDRVDMANSMESRPAFLDHHLAEFSTTIPPRFRIAKSVEKWVLREAMREILPETLYNREKFAFMAPPGRTDAQKQQAVERLCQKWLAPERLHEAGILSVAQVENYLRSIDDDQDGITSRRHDIIVNHLIQIEILAAMAGEACKPVKS